MRCVGADRVCPHQNAGLASKLLLLIRVQVSHSKFTAVDFGLGEKKKYMQHSTSILLTEPFLVPNAEQEQA